MRDLSVLIPARREEFLALTVQNILENIEADTEVIVTLDGDWADPPIPQHPRVNVIYVPEAIGQRAATNIAARIAQGKYVAKVDAHCQFAKGFDRVMIEGFAQLPDGDNCTMVPVMRNLWAFDLECQRCGSRWYQGPTPTRCLRHEGNRKVPNEACQETENFKRIITWRSEARRGETAYHNWKGRRSPASYAYCFDSEPHFQYHSEYAHRPEVQKQRQETGFTESMSLQGSFFMATREKYWELNLCDESMGSWGNQGIELACKTWLSGGRVVVNHSTFYAHLFRTQGQDFGFPYPQHGKEVQRTKEKVWEFFLNGKWDKQIHPVSWLIEKFAPVRGWDDQALQRLKEKEVANGWPREEIQKTGRIPAVQGFTINQGAEGQTQEGIALG